VALNTITITSTWSIFMDYKGIKALLDSSYQRGHFYLTCQIINCLIFSSS